jgi:catechol 2,3-dioxygenase-like lactoylglutathione lyase family enzyme
MNTSCSVLRTNHTSFTVRSLARSVAFFTEVLGFHATSIADRDPASIERITGVRGAHIRVAYVRGAGHSVELIEYSAPAERRVVDSRPCDAGFAHIAFDVTGLDDLIEAAAHHGFRPMGEVITASAGPNVGGRAVYLRDTDGVVVELIEQSGDRAGNAPHER